MESIDRCFLFVVNGYRANNMSFKRVYSHYWFVEFELIMNDSHRNGRASHLKIDSITGQDTSKMN
jgi:hypothetical protein